MTVQWGEAFNSQQSTTKPISAQLSWKAWGSSTKSEVEAAAYNISPFYVLVGGYNVPRQAIKVDPDSSANSSSMWVITADYYLSVFPVQYSTTGGTAKITNPLSRRAVYLSGGSGSGSDGSGIPGIGWNGQEYEGVEVGRPNFTWTETHTFPIQLILNWDYANFLATITHSVNDSTFRGWDAGEVKFDGVVNGGVQKNEIQGDIQYQFSVSPNSYRYTDTSMASGGSGSYTYSGPGYSDGSGTITYGKVGSNGSGISIGDISGIQKRGWDYLWVMYEDDATATIGGKKVRVKKPKAVFIDQVYYDSNFALMGIGT
jgi:hypothetical protein